jgi:hypothetical protein
MIHTDYHEGAEGARPGGIWHSKLTAPVSNGPISYELDGQQYVVVGAGDTFWSFATKK